jgi:hypothetical protein
MITLNLPIPEPVAAEYYAAADELNRRFPGASPKLDAKNLMAFALARHDCAEICSQFDLALRLVRGGPPFNPVLGEEFGRDDRPVPEQPARKQAAA